MGFGSRKHSKSAQDLLGRMTHGVSKSAFADTMKKGAGQLSDSVKSGVGQFSSIAKNGMGQFSEKAKSGVGQFSDFTKNMFKKTEADETVAYSKGKREISSDGYIKYNISDEEAIYITKTPISAAFNEGMPVTKMIETDDDIVKTEEKPVVAPVAPVATAAAPVASNMEFFKNVPRGSVQDVPTSVSTVDDVVEEEAKVEETAAPVNESNIAIESEEILENQSISMMNKDMEEADAFIVPVSEDGGFDLSRFKETSPEVCDEINSSADYEMASYSVPVEDAESEPMKVEETADTVQAEEDHSDTIDNQFTAIVATAAAAPTSTAVEELKVNPLADDSFAKEPLAPVNVSNRRKAPGTRFVMRNGWIEAIKEDAKERQLNAPVEINDEVADVMKMTVPSLNAEDVSVDFRYDTIPADAMDDPLFGAVYKPAKVVEVVETKNVSVGFDFGSSNNNGKVRFSF